MAEWLIIIGVTALIVTTLGLMHAAGSRGHSALFFLIPLASLGQVQRNWEDYRWWALARVAALLTTAVGIGLLLLSGQAFLGSAAAPMASQSGQVMRGEQRAQSTAFVSSEEAAMLAIKGEGKPLAGRLHGKAFHYDRVALINGVLTLSQGRGFLSDLEVRIVLDWDPDDITERRTLLINPSDQDAPVVHLSWKPEGKDFPETRIFKEGYKMELALAPLDKEQLTGSLELIMPDSYKSYLVGDFTAYTNNLRYRNGQVDLHYDHPDTLAHVSREYLNTQFPEGALDSIQIDNVQMHRSEGTGEVVAKVMLTNGAVQERSLQLEKSSVGWSVTPGSMESREISPAREGESQLVDPATLPEQEQTPRVPAPVTRTFPELVAYNGQQVTIETRDGDSLPGIIRGVGADSLKLEMAVGSGSVERNVDAGQVVSVLLANGQQVNVKGDDDSAGTALETEDDGSVDSPPATQSKPAEPPVAPSVTNSKLPALGQLQGKEVTVTAGDGSQRRGILTGVESDHVTLSVPMGAGSMEYFYDLDSISNIEAVKH
ncbi:hypothetical protein A11A3_06325 [Alcanivorax hongdengensis A-11-3]|uniref:Uncharacterized protein n=1 Tax=Alcanivorax hongdengensis A-11-3 TaxID=1177179 RepID=L0WCZ8_9GAMM|nr:hypothetical protein [Alcanivorax hongdengensis]EKF74826.1 hypothetical protein A11A3_06325 [Alcanivorax hongdengensis A-11-3]